MGRFARMAAAAGAACCGIAMLLSLAPLRAQQSQGPLGAFEAHADVGTVAEPGTVAGKDGEFVISGGGANMWADRDAFHFVWKRVSGDLDLTADVEMLGTGGDPHRKAGIIVRESLDPASSYADAAVHGNGLISLQFRRAAGAQTDEAQSAIGKARRIRLERHGDVFSLSVAREDGVWHPAAALTVALPDPVYVGLFVCAHDAGRIEKARFTNVSVTAVPAVPDDKREVESTLETMQVATAERTIVRRTREHFEAPNWSRDGRNFLYNSGGKLFELPAAGGEPRRLDRGDLPPCNNDHGFSPDGRFLAASCGERGASYVHVLNIDGSGARRITPLTPSYWHGWSPDGKTLAYVGRRDENYDIYTLPASGSSGDERRLTTAPGLDDGPDYSPDGQWIWFNSLRDGAMRIWRMHPDGSAQTQMTRDEAYADWFPHPSPDGKWIAFLSFDKSVEGHPANKDVVLRLMPADSSAPPRVLTHLFGGQGTMNVPSWAPDSSKVAFVSYQLLGPLGK